MNRRPVVLYNPRGEGHILPLALVHVGSMAPRDRVLIVDGRVELAPEARVVELGKEALCLAVSVLTGAPILDALRVSRAAKLRSISGNSRFSSRSRISACKAGSSTRTSRRLFSSSIT